MSFELIPIGNFGALGVKSSKVSDSRGSLARIYENSSLIPDFKVQEVSWVSNLRKFTLRGLHFQTGEFSEKKLIFCTIGKVLDVGVDLRPDSESYLKHFTLEIGPSSEFQGVLMPKNFAHGYLTLERNSSLVYLMDNSYSPSNSGGLLWNDEMLQISWPHSPKVISERDKSWSKITK
jgi:dTDP-4-dehydrorhamnose 3,5-epimerase